jgi:hypothetical protein
MNLGLTNEVITEYLKVSASNYFISSKDKSVNEVYIHEGEIESKFLSSDGFVIVSLIVISKIAILVSLDFIITTNTSIPVCFATIGTLNYKEMINIDIGENKLVIKLFTNNLALGAYNLSIDITIPNERYLDRNSDCLGFEVVKINGLSRQLQPEWGYGYTTINAIRV